MSRPKVIKTNILKHNKNLQKLIGLGGYEQEDVPMAKRQLTFMSILMSSSMITCSINLYNYMGQVKIATELMFCAALYTVVLSSFFTVIRNRDTVRGFFHEIQRFVDERNAHRNDDFYPKTEQMIRTITKYYFIITLAGSFLYGFVPFIVVGYCKARDTYNISKWTLHYNNVWLPFALNSSARYTFVNIIQSMSCWTATTVLITIMSMYFGIILYIKAFLQDFQFFFEEMDAMARIGDFEWIHEKLRSLIYFHVSVLDLSRRLGKMMRIIVFVTFTPSVLSICGSLFRGQSGSEKMEWSAIYGSCFTLCYIIAILFLLCFFGNVLTMSLLDVPDYCYVTNWYTYPPKIQTYIAFMIRSSQKRFNISAYGIMPCTLENLLKVLNTTASAYMVMRKFY